MKNRYFKGFNHLFGRAKKSAARTLKERLDEIRGSAPGQLHALFAETVEPEKITGANGCREAALCGRCDRLGHARDRCFAGAVCAMRCEKYRPRFARPMGSKI